MAIKARLVANVIEGKDLNGVAERGRNKVAYIVDWHLQQTKMRSEISYECENETS